MAARNVPWAPGTACPKCGSNRYLPIKGSCESLDYETADRSQGYALEDIRLGKLAQWCGLITPKQYTVALKRQEQTASENGACLPLGDILVKDRVLSKKQARALLRLRSRPRPDPSDNEFGQRALAAGQLKPEQFTALTELQNQLSAGGRDVPPLCLLAYEKRLVQENQIVALVKSQERQDSGLMADFQEEETALTAVSSLDRIVGPKGAPYRRLKVAGLALAPLLLVLLVTRHIKGKDYIQVLCESCGLQTTLEYQGDWPQACADCGQKAAYPAAVCRQCGHVFMVKNPRGRGIRCPKCKSDQWDIYRHDTISKSKPAKASGAEALDPGRAR